MRTEKIASLSSHDVSYSVGGLLYMDLCPIFSFLLFSLLVFGQNFLLYCNYFISGNIDIIIFFLVFLFVFISVE